MGYTLPPGSNYTADGFWLGAGQRGGHARPVLADRRFLYRERLESGMPVWCQTIPGCRSAVAMLVVKVGARHENSHEAGISHLIEHLLFAGSLRWDEEQIEAFIPGLGGEYNAWTDIESTGFHVRVPAERLTPALHWLAQVVFHPAFPVEKIERERRIIGQERAIPDDGDVVRRSGGALGNALDRSIRAALFPGGNLDANTIGTRRHLSALDPHAIVRHYQRFYRPDNAALVVVGNVEPRTVMRAARRAFRDLGVSFGSQPLPSPHWRDNGPHEVIASFWPTKQIQVVAGARTVGLLHPDRWSLEVLAGVLQRAVRRELRQRRGLAYAPFVAHETFSDAGYLKLSSDAAWECRREVLDTFQATIARMQDGEIDRREVASVVRVLAGQATIYGDDPMGVAEYLSQWALLLPDELALPDDEIALRAVRAVHLAQAADRYFTPERSFTGWCEPIFSRQGMGRLVRMLPSIPRLLWLVACGRAGPSSAPSSQYPVRAGRRQEQAGRALK